MKKLIVITLLTTTLTAAAHHRRPKKVYRDKGRLITVNACLELYGFWSLGSQKNKEKITLRQCRKIMNERLEKTRGH